MSTTSILLSANLKKAKVLIVEDNDYQWLIIQQAMSHCLSGVTLQRTSNLAQTVTLIESWQYQEWEYPKLILPLRRTVGSLLASECRWVGTA